MVRHDGAALDRLSSGTTGFPSRITARVGKSSDVNPSLSSLHFEVLMLVLSYLYKMEGSSLR